MKISVILPVWNHAEYLRKSIESVLNQTYKNFELIICDDGSEDNSWIIINSYNDNRIRIYRNTKNLGPIYSINFLLSIAKGDCFTRQDDDDISHPAKLEKMIKLIKLGYNFVSCRSNKINADNSKRKLDSWAEMVNKADANTIKKDILNNNYLACGGTMWTRKVFDKIGFLDPESGSPDYNYWIRILKYFDVGVVDEFLYSNRIHNKSWRRLTPDSGKGHNLAIEHAKRKPCINKFPHKVIVRGR